MAALDHLSSIDLSTRAKRRKAAGLACSLLERIHAAEEACLGNFPENLQGGEAYANSESSAECLFDSVVALMDAY